MTSKILCKARNYEEDFGKRIAKEERPDFHLTPYTGWMNDPNGFSCYQGLYHLFYQYYPYDSKWGPMHWGHAVSHDLLRWKYLPCVLAPDKAYDRDGCFSGSAAELPDGRHLLMYTGVSKERDSYKQTQCIAVGDGKDYEKYEQNPVLDEKDIPEGSGTDFRDPKMWKKADGSYECVVGSRPADGSGQILLYQSADGFHWKFKNVLVSNRGRFGRMWECPDFFELDEKWILLVSPQEMLPSGFEYHNGDGTLCLIGDYDEETGTFREMYNQSVDYGIDFYAPQTVLAPDGRRIMIGWMQNWDTCRNCPQDGAWFGQMSLPRELSVKNGRMYQRPIRELETMRSNKVKYKDVSISGVVKLDGIRGRKVDMELTVWPAEKQEFYEKFVVSFAQDDICYTTVSFWPRESILQIDRKFSGSRRDIIHQRSCMINTVDGKLKLRIILDRFSAEIFVGDGEQVLSAAIHTRQEADGISFFADGNAKMDIVKYELG